MNIEALLTGCVVHKGRDIAVCAMQEAGKGGKTSFHVLLNGNWFGYEEEPEWAATGIAGMQYPGLEEVVVVATAADGRIWELNPSSKAERLARMAQEYCGITRLATLREGIWACGMGRMVMMRDANGRWLDLSAPKGSLADGITGFTGIAETLQGDQVAVGWRGEIWIRSNGNWIKEDSPSNSNFNNVSVAVDGEIVIVGDRGGLVVGYPGEWTAIDCRTDFNLQGVCHFLGETFICSDFEIFCLKQGKLVRETRFDGEQRPNTCMNFLVGKDGIYCQGERDLFRFEEGRWINVL